MNLAETKYDEAWSSTAKASVGAGYYDSLGGRIFHYAYDGGSGGARGKMFVAVDIVTNHVNLSFQTAPAVGDTQVKVTLGGTAAAQDLYKNGWLNVQDGTGEGRAYPIEGNMYTAASGTCVITLKDQIDTAGALAEANVDLHKNLYNYIKINPHDQADTPVGVPLRAVTASYYGWVQTWGACAVLMDETGAVGDNYTLGAGVDGAVEAADAADEPFIGISSMQAGVDTEYQLVYLKLDPTVGQSG